MYLCKLEIRWLIGEWFSEVMQSHVLSGLSAHGKAATNTYTVVLKSEEQADHSCWLFRFTVAKKLSVQMTNAMQACTYVPVTDQSSTNSIMVLPVLDKGGLLKCTTKFHHSYKRMNVRKYSTVRWMADKVNLCTLHMPLIECIAPFFFFPVARWLLCCSCVLCNDYYIHHLHRHCTRAWGTTTGVLGLNNGEQCLPSCKVTLPNMAVSATVR